MHDVHRVVTPRMQRMHRLRRSSICIDSIGTIHALFIGRIVLKLMLCLRVIVDADAAKMLSPALSSATSFGVPAISIEALASQGVELFCPGRQVG